MFSSLCTSMGAALAAGVVILVLVAAVGLYFLAPGIYPKLSGPVAPPSSSPALVLSVDQVCVQVHLEQRYNNSLTSGGLAVVNAKDTIVCSGSPLTYTLDPQGGRTVYVTATPSPASGSIVPQITLTMANASGTTIDQITLPAGSPPVNRTVTV